MTQGATIRSEGGGTRPARRLDCDEDGVRLGGCFLVTRDPDDQQIFYRTRPERELGGLLSAAYGQPIDARRYHATWQRVARLMTSGQLGLAQITAIQMRLPHLPDEAAIDRIAKADALLKFNPNHRGPGPGGGQFTSAPGGGANPKPKGQAAVQAASKPKANLRPAGRPKRDSRLSGPPNPGVPVVLPGGHKIRDPGSPTGYLMSPVADLSKIAEAGRQAGLEYRDMIAHKVPAVAALAILELKAYSLLREGGRFDYQRTHRPTDLSHLRIGGFLQHPQFQPVANFNVGVYMQQTGVFTKEETLENAGRYAQIFSSNRHPGAPYNLDPVTAHWIGVGYDTSKKGAFQKANTQ